MSECIICSCVMNFALTSCVMLIYHGKGKEKKKKGSSALPCFKIRKINQTAWVVQIEMMRKINQMVISSWVVQIEIDMHRN